MKIEKIVITVSLEKGDKPTHATKFTFHDGMWSSNGAVYSRLHEGLHYIWRVVRKVIVEGKTPLEVQDALIDRSPVHDANDDDRLTIHVGPDDDKFTFPDPKFKGTMSRS